MAGRGLARTLSAGLGAALTGCALSLVPAALAARPSACSGHHAIARSGRTVVYQRRSHKRGHGGVPQIDFYACELPHGNSYLLGYTNPKNGSGEYGPNRSLDGVKVAGKFATAEFETGEAAVVECDKYSIGTNQKCPPPMFTISVLALPSGRSLDFTLTDAGGVSEPFAISSAGAIAWIDDRGLVATALAPGGHGQLTGNPSVLDAAAAGIVSVVGQTVTWFDVVGGADVQHSATAPSP